MDNNNFLGELNLKSLHGGCDVIKGSKWIATTWVPAPEIDSPEDLPLPDIKDEL